MADSQVMINQPCAVENLPENVYHADPVQGGSLSYSGMKELLKSPAHYRYYMDTPRAPKPAFDEGHIIHSLVLGTPLDVVEVPFADYRTKAAKDARDAAYSAGLIPVRAGELKPLERVADAVLMHPIARELFEHDGPVELSMFAQDQTGVWIRGRADKVSEHEGELVLVDLKTTRDASPRDFNRAIAQFGYHIQAHLYGRLYAATHKTVPPEMLFVAVSKTEPHLVSVNRLDWEYEDIAQKQIREAIRLYKACTDTNEWPGYPNEIESLTPPYWLAAEHEEEVELTL